MLFRAESTALVLWIPPGKRAKSTAPNPNLTMDLVPSAVDFALGAVEIAPIGGGVSGGGLSGRTNFHSTLGDFHSAHGHATPKTTAPSAVVFDTPNDPQSTAPSAADSGSAVEFGGQCCRFSKLQHGAIVYFWTFAEKQQHCQNA